MDGARNTHAYKALDSSRHEIRVLQLLAGDAYDGKVRATLIHADLDQRPVYDALSYTWGDPADTTTIELDGNEDFKVTKNAALALHDLRSSVQFTHIWVDSICINQDNVAERNSQVMLMRRIYGQAQTVRTWVDYEIDTQSPFYRQLINLNDNSTVQALGEDPHMWDPMVEVSQLSYWGRVDTTGGYACQCSHHSLSDNEDLKQNHHYFPITFQHKISIERGEDDR